MAVGTWMAVDNDFKPIYPLDTLGVHLNAYTAVFALAANLVVTIVLTVVLRAAGQPDAADETRPSDFNELAEEVPVRERPPEPAVRPA
jgi:SSS family solute:Na+ symporter